MRMTTMIIGILMLLSTIISAQATQPDDVQIPYNTLLNIDDNFIYNYIMETGAKSFNMLLNNSIQQDPYYEGYTISQGSLYVGWWMPILKNINNAPIGTTNLMILEIKGRDYLFCQEIRISPTQCYTLLYGNINSEEIKINESYTIEPLGYQARKHLQRNYVMSSRTRTYFYNLIYPPQEYEPTEYYETIIQPFVTTTTTTTTTTIP